MKIGFYLLTFVFDYQLNPETKKQTTTINQTALSPAKEKASQ